MKKLLALVLTLSIGLNSIQPMCKAESISELKLNKIQTQVAEKVAQEKDTNAQDGEIEQEKDTNSKDKETVQDKETSTLVEKSEQELVDKVEKVKKELDTKVQAEEIEQEKETNTTDTETAQKKETSTVVKKSKKERVDQVKSALRSLFLLAAGIIVRYIFEYKYSEGYEQGYGEGYEQGYGEGYSDASQIISNEVYKEAYEKARIDLLKEGTTKLLKQTFQTILKLSRSDYPSFGKECNKIKDKAAKAECRLRLIYEVVLPIYKDKAF